MVILNVRSGPLVVMNDYHSNFSPASYLETRYKDPEKGALHSFSLQCLHSFFSEAKAKSEVANAGSHGYKVLDYGCGPAVAKVISAAAVATEVVFAEYTEKNRSAVQRWLDKDSSAWNWSPYFKHIVVTLEGQSEHEAVEREKYLRSITRAVVPCDVTQDPPIVIGFEGPYDVVISSLSIEAGCPTLEDYKIAVRRVSNLLKSGGSLLLYSVIRNDTSKPGSYRVGSECFTEIPLTLEFIHATLKEAALEVVTTKYLALSDHHEFGDGAAFIVAKKN